jgi:hypothetical protein
MGEVLRNAVLTALGRAYTSLPGIVQSYDASTKTAAVTLALQQPALLADGTYELRDLGTLANVPVKFPRGGGYSIEFPLSKGDGVLVVFTMYDHRAWRDQGNVADPGDVRSHSLAGAIAIPGFETVAQAAGHPGPTTCLVIGKDGGSPDFVALAAKVDANLQTLVNILKNAAPGPGYGAAVIAALAALTPPDTLPSVAASDVKAT